MSSPFAEAHPVTDAPLDIPRSRLKELIDLLGQRPFTDAEQADFDFLVGLLPRIQFQLQSEADARFLAEIGVRLD